MLKRIKSEAEALQNQIVQWRRDLHRIPEVGIDTPQSEAYICSCLESMGIPFRKNVGRHGIVALVKGKKAGGTFAFRADFDALPIREETGLPFASKNSNMHACGHDSHTAMILGAAKILQGMSEDLAGNVKFIFQPGEEGIPGGPGGAWQMIQDGALEDPRPDAMTALHIGTLWNDPALLPGDIGYHRSGIMACMDRFSITVKGKGSHGAQPHQSIDAAFIASSIVCALQAIVSRELNPVYPSVVSIGQIHAGSAFNVIPEECFIEGTVRVLSDEMRRYVADRIGQIAGDIASAYRAKIEYNYNWDGPPPVVNDSALTEHFRTVAESLFGPERVHELRVPSMGGDDLAFFFREVPGTFFYLHSANPSKQADFPHHNPRFSLDEDVFWRGTAALAAFAYDWLDKNSGSPTPSESARQP